LAADEPAGALERLDQITRRLRRECPWDREQDERSIVPHTVEEAYELADAALNADDPKLVDELGDVLFQVVFLSLLLEERGAGDLASVADHCREKLIRRHPHVFGEEVEAATAGEVLRNWDQIKSEQEGGGAFGDLPRTLPATLYAKKVRRRAARGNGHDIAPSVAVAAGALERAGGRNDRFEAAGELLLAAVALATDAGADPELALRAAADRHKKRSREADANP